MRNARVAKSSSGAKRTPRHRAPGKKTSRAAAIRKRAPAASALERAAETAGHVVGSTVARVAGRFLPSVPNDPIEMLERDHRRFEALLEEGEKSTERATTRRAALLATLKAALETHELLEEKLFYPALKAHRAARDIVLEGYEEHHVADVLVRELERLPAGDERWGAKFKVLKENIAHHIEEEEGEMFKTARAVLTREQLRELGARMQAMRASRTRA